MTGASKAPYGKATLKINSVCTLYRTLWVFTPLKLWREAENNLMTYLPYLLDDNLHN